MFKRCHRLKRSHIKIPASLREETQGKPIQFGESEKQNITINYTYSNVKMCRSIQVTKSHSRISPPRPNPNHRILPHSNVIQKVKQLCGQIETTNQKIRMYRTILATKQDRHTRDKTARIEQKEKMLAALISEYQLQRDENQVLIKELSLLTGRKSSFSSERRTTATFNFFPCEQ